MNKELRDYYKKIDKKLVDDYKDYKTAKWFLPTSILLLVLGVLSFASLPFILNYYPSPYVLITSFLSMILWVGVWNFYVQESYNTIKSYEATK